MAVAPTSTLPPLECRLPLSHLGPKLGRCGGDSDFVGPSGSVAIITMFASTSSGDVVASVSSLTHGSWARVSYGSWAHLAEGDMQGYSYIYDRFVLVPRVCMSDFGAVALHRPTIAVPGTLFLAKVALGFAYSMLRREFRHDP